MRKFLFVFFGLLLSFNSFCAQLKSVQYPENDTYILYISNYDWGAGAYKVVFKVEETVKNTEVNVSDFNADVVLYTSKIFDDGYGIKKGNRIITDAYLCTPDGKKCEDVLGTYIALDMSVGPDNPLSDPYTHYVMFDGISDMYGLHITNQKLNIDIKKCAGYYCESLSVFTIDSFVYAETSMTYAGFVPKKTDKKKIPLIIWLNEGLDCGSNVVSSILEKNVVKLTQNPVQNYFKNGACVLLPLCPGNWLESQYTNEDGSRKLIDLSFGEKSADYKSFIKNMFFKNKETDVKGDKVISASFYTKALKSLIDKYIEDNPCIDKKRIYLGGCASGGYMSLNMVLQYPTFFAAVFPVCEAYPDALISDSDINILKDFPMWFSYSYDDYVYNPDFYSRATVNRLKKINCSELHEIVFESITDNTGLYNQTDGSPYIYDSHSAWVYVLDDRSLEGNLSLFDWMSLQRR